MEPKLGWDGISGSASLSFLLRSHLRILCQSSIFGNKHALSLVDAHQPQVSQNSYAFTYR